MTDGDDAGAVILFDGVCNLCNGSVQFVIKRDRQKYFRFASLQSDSAIRVLSEYADFATVPDSIVLIEDHRVWVKSAAILRIARHLRFPWPAAYAFTAIPRPLRDWVYDLVARHRYRWFGRKDYCMVPTPELQDRFLK